MEKIQVLVVSLLMLGTVLCMIGRFTPGLFRADNALSVSGGKVVNASAYLAYYYMQVSTRIYAVYINITY